MLVVFLYSKQYLTIYPLHTYKDKQAFKLQRMKNKKSSGGGFILHTPFAAATVNRTGKHFNSRAGIQPCPNQPACNGKEKGYSRICRLLFLPLV
jgi:hypothetical protein